MAETAADGWVVAPSSILDVVLADNVAFGVLVAALVIRSVMTAGSHTTWIVPINSTMDAPSSDAGNGTALMAPELIACVII